MPALFSQSRSIRRLPAMRRSGAVSRGLIFMFAGFSDIVLAMLMWYFIGRGEMMFTVFFAFIGLTGLGLIALGVILNLRDA